MNKNEKDFDTMKFVRSVREKHYNKIKNMNNEEKIDFFQKIANNIEQKLKVEKATQNLI